MYKEYDKFLFTRNKITETYCGHGHEAEVKSVEKIPIVLPQHKHTSATGEIQEEQNNGGTCTCKGNHQIGNQLNQLNLPSDRRPVTFVGIHESFARNGSFDFIINAMCTTTLANSFPQSAITIRVRGIPTKAKRMQKIFPQLVEGTTLPYPIDSLQIIVEQIKRLQGKRAEYRSS